jgi:hypothetical protein
MKRAPVTGNELRDQLLRARAAGKLPGLPDTDTPRRQAPPSPHPPGHAAPRGTHKHEETPTMSLSRQEELNAIAKRSGPEVLAKQVLKHGPSGLSEFELTKMFTDGVPRQAGETPTRAFARAFSANDERGELMRRAHAAVRNGQWTRKAKERATGPLMNNEDTFGPDPTSHGAEGDTPEEEPRAAASKRAGDAYVQLQKLAVELRQRAPSLTREQSFAKAYAKYPALAALERKQNRPRVA